MAGRCVWPWINVRTPARCIVVDHRRRRHVHDFGRRGADVHLAAGAQLGGQPPACVETQVTEHPLRDWIAQDPAQALVTRVGRAEHVAMHQHDPLAVQVDDRAVAQELAAGLRGKALADQKIPVAVHEIAGNAAVGESTQGRHDFAHGRVRIVVAEPGLEQVAEDVEGSGMARFCLEKLEQLPRDNRARPDRDAGPR